MPTETARAITGWPSSRRPARQRWARIRGMAARRRPSPAWASSPTWCSSCRPSTRKPSSVRPSTARPTTSTTAPATRTGYPRWTRMGSRSGPMTASTRAARRITTSPGSAWLASSSWARTWGMGSTTGRSPRSVSNRNTPTSRSITGSGPCSAWPPSTTRPTNRSSSRTPAPWRTASKRSSRTASRLVRTTTSTSLERPTCGLPGRRDRRRRCG